jgi:hypothetical protein
MFGLVKKSGQEEALRRTLADLRKKGKSVDEAREGTVEFVASSADYSSVLAACQRDIAAFLAVPWCRTIACGACRCPAPSRGLIFRTSNLAS